MYSSISEDENKGRKRCVNCSLMVHCTWDFKPRLREPLEKEKNKKKKKKTKKIMFKVMLEDAALWWCAAFSRDGDSTTFEWVQHCQHRSYRPRCLGLCTKTCQGTHFFSAQVCLMEWFLLD